MTFTVDQIVKVINPHESLGADVGSTVRVVEVHGFDEIDVEWIYRLVPEGRHVNDFCYRHCFAWQFEPDPGQGPW